VRKILIVLSVLVASTLFAAPARAETGSCSTLAMKDVFVHESNPGPWGGAVSLQARQDAGRHIQSYLAFDVTCVPADATVTGASVRLTVASPPPEGSTVAAEVRKSNSATWDESTINWNNQPGFGATAISASDSSHPENQVETYTLTGDLPAGNGLVGYSMVPTGPNSPQYVRWDSKDAAVPVADKPHLVVQWSRPDPLRPLRQGFTATNDANGITHSAIDHVIIHSDWADLEPTGDNAWNEGGTGWGRITSMIAANPTKKFALRIFAGENAPGWLKNGAAGPCVNVHYALLGQTFCEPRFWLAAYQAEWAELVAQVAARLGAEPRFLDLIASPCTLHFVENGILGGDDPSGVRLFNAGLNQTSYRSCVLNSTANQVAQLSAVGIRSSIAVHTNWQVATAQGIQAAGFPAWRDQVLNPLSTTHTDKLVFQNNGLGTADNCNPGQQSLTNATTLYCWMATRSYLGPAPNLPVGFQFGGITTSAQMRTAAENGINMGGCFIERAVGNLQNLLTPAEITNYDNQLQANCP
jgi:hypothetical protein